jgi:hypothetical protein
MPTKPLSQKQRKLTVYYRVLTTKLGGYRHTFLLVKVQRNLAIALLLKLTAIGFKLFANFAVAMNSPLSKRLIDRRV